MDDRAKLLDIVGGKLPAIVAEWDDGDHVVRAVLSDHGSDCEAILVGEGPEKRGALYLVIEERNPSAMGEGCWSREGYRGDQDITRGLISEMLLGRVNREVRHG